MHYVYETPERTIEQRLDALEKANRHRTVRARWKEAAKRGEVSVAETLIEPAPELATMKVFDALMAMPKWGRVKTTRVLRLTGVSPSKTVAGLSERQRAALISMLPRRVR